MSKIEELDRLMKNSPGLLLIDQQITKGDGKAKGKYLLVQDATQLFLIGAALPIEKHAELLYVFMKRMQYTELYVYGGGLFNQQDRKLYEASTAFGEPPLNQLKSHLNSIGASLYGIEDAVPGDSAPFSKMVTLKEVQGLLMP